MNQRSYPSAKSALKFVLAVVALVPSLACAQESKTAADYLPDTTAIYLDIKNPVDLIETIENHPVLKAALEMKPVQELMATPQFAMAVLGRGLLEAQLGESLLKTLKENVANGIWIGVDTKTNGIILVFRAREEARLKKVAGTILKLIENDAKEKGNQPPFTRIDSRDAVAAKFEDFLVTRCRNWLAISNKPKLARAFVKNVVNGCESPLSKQEWFVKAVQDRKDQDIWAAFDLETIRKVVDNKEAFLGRTDNPGIELVFGGILDALKHSPVANASLNIGEQLDVSVSAPFDADWATESREYFFGKELGGLAPKALTPKKMIASLTSYRDLGLWWLSKEELYAENVIAGLTQADSQLSTIFSGMSFGEDVLGSLEPGAQIVVAENTYDQKYIPDVKIPAIALVGKLKDAKRMQRRLKIAFQSVIGFANINLGMTGQPQLDLETETIDDTKLLSASYFFEEGTEEGLLLFNFAPTIAFRGSSLIVSSNRDLAVELAGLSSEDDKGAAEDSNTQLKLDGQMLHQILEANSESLIAQNMLEEGNDRAAAEQQIEILLLVAKLFGDVQLDYAVEPSKMKLDLAVGFEVQK